VKSLPETDVETEFHTRLLLMKEVRQLDGDGSVFGHFSKASVPAQEEGEIIANLGFTGPQAKHHRRSPAAEKGEGSHRSGSRLAPEGRTGSRRIGARASRRTLAVDPPLDPSPFCWFTALLDRSP
jgi:hypothetical protein